MRVMLGKVLAERFRVRALPSHRKLLKTHKLAKLHPSMPLVRVTHDDYPQWRRPEELSRDKSRYSPWPVVFLVRDPRDVVVSLYFEQSRRVGKYVDKLRRRRSLADVRDRIAPYRGALSDFVREDVGSVASYLAFLDVWSDVPDTLVVRYEDLHAAPRAELRRILEHFGVDGVRPELVEDAVRFASVGNLRRLEAEGAFRTHKLEPADPGDPESFKVRRGVVGGYRAYLDEGDIAWIESRMAAELDPRWGYAPSRR